MRQTQVLAVIYPKYKLWLAVEENPDWCYKPKH